MASWASVEQSLERIVAFPAPDSGHVFDVPQVPDAPTQDDVRHAIERLIQLEAIAADIPDTVLDLSRLKSMMSHTFSYDEATAAQADAYLETVRYADELIAEWLSFQALVAQQIGHWQSAVAVMEHDLAWQEYEAASGLRHRRLRPSPAAALAIAEESWLRCC